MIKFLYVVSLGITSFLLFIFSKEKDMPLCENQATGTITLLTDSSGTYLGITTDKNLTLHPSSINNDVILAAGQHVTVCYSIDSSKPANDPSVIQAHIRSISYSKQ